MGSTIDERGRVLIPKEIREAYGLRAGQTVRFETDEEGIHLRPTISKEAFMERFCGALNAETRRPDAEPMDPLELKRIWEPTP